MKIIKFACWLYLCVSFWGCTGSSTQFVSPSHQQIKYVGRINFEDPESPIFYWSGSSVSVNFTGSSISVILSDEEGLNYFNVVIDNDSVYPLKLVPGDSCYILAENLASNVNHTLSLVKRNEWITGSTAFKGFKITDGGVLKADPKSGRLMEFYGNSITAGYAIEDNSGGDSPDSTFTNNYVTYAAVTARHFNADLHCTVRSGIGIQVSWERPIMPEIYNRLDPRDSLSIWEFSKATPDIVVVNLMQNDSWLVERPKHKEFKYRFGKEKPTPEKIVEAYASFVKGIREVYPDTHIICALGSMDATKEGSPWPGFVSSAVESIQDDKIYTHFFPYIEKRGHPRVEDNKKMAESLIAFIEKNITW
ncbi:electron transporter RnfD [Labilibacter sediminis]|nr:electron transporter RnfD [Labilibacter sediminis]